MQHGLIVWPLSNRNDGGNNTHQNDTKAFQQYDFKNHLSAELNRKKLNRCILYWCQLLITVWPESAARPHVSQETCSYRARLNSFSQVWWILLLLSLTTSAYLPAAFTKPGRSLLAEPCTCKSVISCSPAKSHPSSAANLTSVLVSRIRILSLGGFPWLLTLSEPY